MKLVIVGGVAGGATAAARARRMSEDAEITLVERGPYVSFANCGLPYHVSGDIPKRSKLLLQTPEGFDSRYRVKVLARAEAVGIDRAGKRVRVVGPEGESWLDYDRLILAQGGNPVLPSVPGADSARCFKLWTIPDMDRLQAFIAAEKPATAVVVGGGFVGLEMAEAFVKRGLSTAVVELQSRVMPTMDPEFGGLVERELAANGVVVTTGAAVRAYDEASREIELSDGRRIPADLVLFSVGVRPELVLAKDAGLELGATGALLVDEFLATSDPSIWAAGDMCEVTHAVSGRKTRVPLAGPANRQGRIAASNALGERIPYRGAFGTSVFKVFEKTAAATGLTEKAAREAGFDAAVAVVWKDHHAAYYPGAKELAFKLVWDRATRRALGAQAFGEAGVEKRVDVVAVALKGRLTIDDLSELDLAYAPPYSTANDPVNVAAFVAMNDASGFSPVETAEDLRRAFEEGRTSGRAPFVLDVRNRGEFEAGHVPGAVNVPVDELRDSLADGSAGLPAEGRIHVLCRSGFRGHLATRMLIAAGRKDVRNVTGGQLSVDAAGGIEIE